MRKNISFASYQEPAHVQKNMEIINISIGKAGLTTNNEVNNNIISHDKNELYEGKGARWFRRATFFSELTIT